MREGHQGVVSVKVLPKHFVKGPANLKQTFLNKWDPILLSGAIFSLSWSAFW